MMPKVEFRCVKEVPQGRPGGIEGPVPELDVGVTKGVDDVKENEVGSDHCPVLSAKGKEGDEHGGAKGDDVDNLQVRVRGQGEGGSD